MHYNGKVSLRAALLAAVSGRTLEELVCDLIILSAGGFHDWAEIWVRYIGELLVHMVEHNHASLEVKQQRFSEYNKTMDIENENLIWENEGVVGYYVNQYGRSGVNMPWTKHQFLKMIKAADPDDF